MANNPSPICRRKSTRYMGVPLRSIEQTYLVFLIPALINCILYIIHFAADLVVAVQHIREGNPIWGYSTIALMYAPALVYFVLTVSRPDWWITDDDKVTKGVCGWFLIQICQLVGFLFFALYRYAGLIVLSIDAIFLSGDARTKTLNLAAAPAAIELYFFLQAWFQAAPQAVFQTHLLFREQSEKRTQQSVNVQVLCILMSIVMLAVQTSLFQRFESQRVNGRKLPWAMWLKKYRVQEMSNLEERAPLQLAAVKDDVTAQTPEAEAKSEDTTEETQTECKEETDSHVTLDRQISITPPLPPRNAHIAPPPTPLRGITSVAPLPVPDAPAPPRPDSICNASEQLESEAPGAKVVTLPKPNQKGASAHSLKMPKRKYSKKGLEEDDPVGKFLSFLWWFFFILARVLAIVVFYEFYPVILLAVLGTHYVVMLIYLFYYAKYYDVITFFVNLWLGLVYVFCLIEYRIKFKYADKWLLPYYAFVVLQNTCLTLTWYFLAEWEDFWFTYIVCVIFVSMALCTLSTSLYHAILKPKKCRVYSS